MKKHIVFTGGGTGGHVYPALSIIEILKDEGYKISWIGSKKGIEYQIISKENIDFYSIPCGKLRRYFSLRNFLDLFKIFLGFIRSLYLLKRLKPDCLFSKGGYVTVPPVIASKLLNIKSFTHESDFDPGLATRINSKFVNKVFLPYNETMDYLPTAVRSKAVVTGNPVRKAFYSSNPELGKEKMGFKNDKPIILVIGGSLGAKQINDLMFESKEDIEPMYNVYHQMGDKNFIEVNEESYKTVPYIHDNISDIISASSIVVSRSGAGSLWEFSTIGKGMILIPLGSGSRGDQIKNANYFEKKGAAIVLTGDNVNKTFLVNSLKKVIDNNEIESLSNRSKEIIESNSALKISQIIKECI